MKRGFYQSFDLLYTIKTLPNHSKQPTQSAWPLGINFAKPPSNSQSTSLVHVITPPAHRSTNTARPKKPLFADPRGIRHTRRRAHLFSLLNFLKKHTNRALSRGAAREVNKCRPCSIYIHTHTLETVNDSRVFAQARVRSAKRLKGKSLSRVKCTSKGDRSPLRKRARRPTARSCVR